MTSFDPTQVPGLTSLELRVRRLVEGRHLGLHRSPYRGSSAEFAEYRQYIPGDNIRDIDWRVFARTDRFYVKRYEEETNLTAHIIIDATASMDFNYKWESASLLAGTIAYILAGQGDEVGVHVIGEDKKSSAPRRGNPARYHALKLLDSVNPKGTGTLAPVIESVLPQLRRTGLVVVISDFLSDSQEELQTSLRLIRSEGHEAMALHMVSREELDLRAVGPTRYVDPETDEHIDTIPEEIRIDYKKRIDNHLKSVSGMFQILNYDHLLVVAEEGPGMAFGRFLMSKHRAPAYA